MKRDRNVTLPLIRASRMISFWIFRLYLGDFYEYRNNLYIPKYNVWKNDYHCVYINQIILIWTNRGQYYISNTFHAWTFLGQLQLRRSVQVWGKWHGIINISAVIIKFHNKSSAAFGCQMTSRWSSALQRAT